MTRFRHFLAVDWSGAAGERHKGIALAIAEARGGPPVLLPGCPSWSRTDVLAASLDLPEDTLVGVDLGISLPFADCGAFFPGLPESPPDARSLWALVDRVCAQDDHLAASAFVDDPRFAPYFRRHGGREGERFRCDDAAHGRGRFRVTEARQAELGCKPYSNFNLVGAAQVGKSSLTGMRVLHRLGDRVPVWPVDPLPDSGSLIVEIYTALAALEAGRSASRSKMRSYEEVNGALATLGSPTLAQTGPIDDHSADALLTAAWLRKVAGEPARWNPAGLTPEIARTEGWTFGVA
ncbi:hypothetical protein MKP08_07345 [Erythrobacter sp. LQ02-29]|uniref:hypothetical protein n=1 Tax=Erythrobacter sp. LQ02-29 TaxID=2920384 RepID=UPI001F4EB9BC|nr:hypothetical protein [Erythrobacter sp. LQ02-29]MCP9222558.1 hypothetical protein [Erythrobacter sp. LQ02-29]